MRPMMSMIFLSVESLSQRNSAKNFACGKRAYAMTCTYVTIAACILSQNVAFIIDGVLLQTDHKLSLGISCVAHAHVLGLLRVFPITPCAPAFPLIPRNKLTGYNAVTTIR